jgi:hypothetical protein
VNGVATLTETGWYALRAVVSFDAVNTVGVRAAAFLLNGDTTATNYVGYVGFEPSIIENHVNLVMDIQLNAGTTIQVAAIQTSGLSLNVVSSYGARFVVMKIF